MSTAKRAAAITVGLLSAVFVFGVFVTLEPLWIFEIEAFYRGLILGLCLWIGVLSATA